MCTLPRSLILSTLFATTLSIIAPVTADDETAVKTQARPLQTLPFKPFTGRVTGNKVRIRLQPNLDGPILRQTPKGELFVVVGETDDFYAVAPSKGTKGYVYRTLILDNVVEGNRVNVRQEPHLESAVVAQLSQGDRVEGLPFNANPKWLEIELPESAKFYISKEYIENAGDANYLAQQEQRQADLKKQLQEALAKVDEELETPYEKSSFEEIKKELNTIISQYNDFPEQQTQAKEALARLQDEYLHKKMRYLEQQSQLQAEALNNRSQQIEAQLTQRQQELEDLKNQQAQNQAPQAPASVPLNLGTGVTPKMLMWNTAEERLFKAWQQNHPGATLNDFYDEQRMQAVWLKGTIEPYGRNVKNKPGDYMLVTAQRLPIAYLYSNMINLEDWVGHQVTIEASERPNNQFAFKAFYVLSVE